MSNTSNNTQQKKPEKKKPYSSPSLSVHGNLFNKTYGGDPSGTNDPGGNSSGKLPAN